MSWNFNFTFHEYTFTSFFSVGKKKNIFQYERLDKNAIKMNIFSLKSSKMHGNIKTSLFSEMELDKRWFVD